MEANATNMGANATNVGANVTNMEANVTNMTANATNVFIDLIYNTDVTSFMREARKHGATAFNGLKMLHDQAEEAWRIWCDNK